MWFPPKDDYPSGEGPEEKMHREQLEQHERDCKMVDCLIASLRVEDRLRKLIPFRLIQKWRLPHRSRPVKDCD